MTDWTQWSRDLAIIDAGHYGTEYIFIEDMKQVSEQKITGTGCVDRSGRTSISDRLNYAGGGGRWKSLYAE